MFIEKLRIFNNYKRFHDLTIDLGANPKRIIALVGPNGCGKSSVFDAMIYHNQAYGGAFGNRNDGYKGNDYHFQSGSEDNNYQSIEITLKGGHSFESIKQMNNNPDGRNTIFSFRSSYRYNSNVNIKEIRAVDTIEKNNIGASTTSDIDQRMEDNYRRLLGKYRDHLEANDCKPSEAKAHIIGELNNAIKKCLSIEITHLGNVEAGNGSLYFKKADHINEFSYNVLSSGEKEVIDILVDLYLRKEIYNDSIFLFDEPELHIHTSVQRKLIMEIDKMVGDNCQIWIATHSIGILRALQSDLRDKSEIIKFDVNNEWAKKSYVLSPMPKTRKNWQELFSTALDDITSLLAPKCIVYCEGRDKPSAAGLDKGMDAKVYNIIFENDYPDTLFVSSGGNTELDQRSEIALAIIGKALPDTEILVLKDRDMGSGKTIDETGRLEYLRLNPDNHRVLKRYEIENYLFDKSVLQKYCQAEARIFDEDKYDSLKLDIVNDDVKTHCTAIKNLCGIAGSINQEKFKIMLATFLTSDLPLYEELRDIVFNRI